MWGGLRSLGGVWNADTESPRFAPTTSAAAGIDLRIPYRPAPSGIRNHFAMGLNAGSAGATLAPGERPGETGGLGYDHLLANLYFGTHSTFRRLRFGSAVGITLARRPDGTLVPKATFGSLHTPGGIREPTLSYIFQDHDGADISLDLHFQSQFALASDARPPAITLMFGVTTQMPASRKAAR